MVQDIDLGKLFEKFDKKFEDGQPVQAEEEGKVSVEQEVDEIFFDIDSILESDDNKEWYVIHTYSGQEQKVKDNIEMRIERITMLEPEKNWKEKIGRIIIPTEKVIEFKNGKRIEVKKKIFPGYLLIQMEIDDKVLFEIRNIQGVTSFVNSGKGNQPAPLSKHEIKSIFQRTAAQPSKSKSTYEIGERVKIMSGPFADFSGVIEDVDEDKSKLKALVDIFGRGTTVELVFDQVIKEN
jgi:transcription termination/antitermination protein NusG